MNPRGLHSYCRDCVAAYDRGEPDPRNRVCVCIYCDQPYEPKQLKSKASYCSRRCKDKAKNEAWKVDLWASRPIDRHCLHCGNQLSQSMRSDAKFCSRVCNNKAHALQRKLRARTGQEDKPGYIRAEICKRDNWECQLCGEPVDPELTHPHPMSPSLDHITPVAHGGNNDPSNLRLTHLICNLQRGTR